MPEPRVVEPTKTPTAGPITTAVTSTRWEVVDNYGFAVCDATSRDGVVDLIPAVDHERTEAYRRLQQQGIPAEPPDPIAGIRRVTTHTVTTVLTSPLVPLELLFDQPEPSIFAWLRWWR